MSWALFKMECGAKLCSGMSISEMKSYLPAYKVI